MSTSNETLTITECIELIIHADWTVSIWDSMHGYKYSVAAYGVGNDGGAMETELYEGNDLRECLQRIVQELIE